LRSPLIVRVDPNLVHVEELTRWEDARPNKNPSCKFAGLHSRVPRLVQLYDADSDDGKCFIVRADEKLTAFLELEAAISGRTADSMKNATSALLASRAERR
jgi:hypothetical protein